MPRRWPRQPVIAQTDIDWLISLDKPVTDFEWRAKLLPSNPGPMDINGRLELGELPPGQNLGGRLHIYTRQALTVAPGDWSVGIVYTDYDDNSYQLIRCNGPHQTDHFNKIERTQIVETPHIHLLTERYQAIGKVSSGYAEPTDAYTDIDGALTTLRDMANLTPDGILFLP